MKGSPTDPTHPSTHRPIVQFIVHLDMTFDCEFVRFSGNNFSEMFNVKGCTYKTLKIVTGACDF